jgi:hypothetical protein
MDIKKIFGFLVVTAVCVVIGAFVLNLLLPNAISSTINTVEKGIKAGTGITFDLNNDGVGNTQLKSGDSAADKAKDGVGVQGLDGLH